MKEYPFCSMGDIIYVVEGNQNYASGFLISKNIVLSCAHNLISSECKQKATNVRFCPSYKEDK